MTVQARRYVRASKAKVIVISGSVGKTSTTQAIATVLSQELAVVSTLNNYNSDVGVPCSVFQQELPTSLRNPFAWLWLLAKNTVILVRNPKVDVFVLELGTDTPGELAQFAWLQPDIAVVTAVAPEHMEYFKTIDAVAKEELSVAAYSDVLLISKQMVDSRYLVYVDNEEVFGYDKSVLGHFSLQASDLEVIGEHSIDAVAAALKCAEMLELSPESTRRGARSVQSQPGRMREFEGIQDSTIIDDTYNSSPEAVTAALGYVYSVKAPQRIALLGNMNELGDSSAAAHTKMGEQCDPKKLDLVVTLGQDANQYTASAAKDAGCNVVVTQTPYEAAKVVKDQMKPGALILCKGSQNGVFAEETVKALLADPSDRAYLVRQSRFWLKIKQRSFKGV